MAFTYAAYSTWEGRVLYLEVHTPPNVPSFLLFMSFTSPNSVLGPTASTGRGLHVMDTVTYPYLYAVWQDLYVSPGHRGKGLGTMLLNVLAKAAFVSGCARLVWQVLDWWVCPDTHACS